jgi:hypothetical protein
LDPSSGLAWPLEQPELLAWPDWPWQAALRAAQSPSDELGRSLEAEKGFSFFFPHKKTNAQPLQAQFWGHIFFFHEISTSDNKHTRETKRTHSPHTGRTQAGQGTFFFQRS